MRGRRRRTAARLFAIVGLVGLICAVGVAAVIVARALRGGEDGAVVALPSRRPAATPTPTPRPTPTPAPTPPPLTAQERAERETAAERVRSEGFEPTSLRSYHPDQTLRVLIGEGTDTVVDGGEALLRRAFFFADATYLGTDATEASESLRVVRQTENTVTLRYGLADGDSAQVRFKLVAGTLVPDTPVPPARGRQG